MYSVKSVISTLKGWYERPVVTNVILWNKKLGYEIEKTKQAEKHTLTDRIWHWKLTLESKKIN